MYRSWSRLFCLFDVDSVIEICHDKIAVGCSPSSDAAQNFILDEKSCGKNSDIVDYLKVSSLFVIERESTILKAHPDDNQPNPNWNPPVITCIGNNLTINGSEELFTGQSRILQNNDTIWTNGSNKKIIKLFQFNDSRKASYEWYPESLKSRFYIGQSIGTGMSGCVRMIHNIKTLEKFALKTFIIPFFSHEITSLASEITIMQILDDHPNIVKLSEVIYTPDYVYLIIEHVDGGDLITFSKSHSLDEKESKLAFYQICNAVKYVHDMNIAHRDIKFDNILVTVKNEKAQYKLCDFGLSRFDAGLRASAGTVNYMAPEVLERHNYDPYTKSVDIWSLGVLLYALMSRTFPFSDENGNIIEERVLTCQCAYPNELFRGVSTEAINLIQRMLVLEPENRLTINEILLHPWFDDEMILENDVELPISIPLLTKPSLRKRKLKHSFNLIRKAIRSAKRHISDVELPQSPVKSKRHCLRSDTVVSSPPSVKKAEAGNPQAPIERKNVERPPKRPAAIYDSPVENKRACVHLDLDLENDKIAAQRVLRSIKDSIDNRTNGPPQASASKHNNFYKIAIPQELKRPAEQLLTPLIVEISKKRIR